MTEHSRRSREAMRTAVRQARRASRAAKRGHVDAMLGRAEAAWRAMARGNGYTESSKTFNDTARRHDGSLRSVPPYALAMPLGALAVLATVDAAEQRTLADAAVAGGAV